MIPHEPFLAFTQKNDERKNRGKIDNVERWFCEWSVSRHLKSNMFYLSVVLQLFSVFVFFISLFVVVMARQRMRIRFCTRKVPGRLSLHSFFDDCSHFKKKRTYTGFTNDNEHNNFWHQKWSVWDTAFFSPLPLFTSLSSPFPLPFLSLSSPFPLLFPFHSVNFSSFSFSPFSFPFSFSFSFSFPFLVLSFPFPFPFSFLSLSFFSPFPILSFPFLYSSFSFSLSSLMWILWSRCEASTWTNDKRNKNTITREKNSWKGSGFLPDSQHSWVKNGRGTCW